MDRTFSLSQACADSLGVDLWRIQEAGRGNSRNRCTGMIVRDANPVTFLEGVFAALTGGCTAWLAAPEWGQERMREMVELINDSSVPVGSIMIPTGGTSGRLRFAAHTWETLSASALGFGEFFGIREGGHRSLCVLPMHHVSGLMQAVRVATLGGRLFLGDPHDPRANLPEGFATEGCFLSLVPTQLRRLLDAGAADWLRRFGTILVGGAAIDASLAERAREERLPLALSYGMTETAALVCALRPVEFLSGATGSGRPLPHVRLEIGADSRLRVHAKSLCRALVPDGGVDLSDGLLTNDIGRFDADGILHVHARADRVIVTGGQKVEPGEIEEALFSTGLVIDAYVTGVPNPEWGEMVVTLYAARDGTDVEKDLSARIRQKLSPVHVPKKWIRLEAVPRNAAGKPDAQVIRGILQGL